MLSLKDFKKNAIAIDEAKSLCGGGTGQDTPGGNTAFGKSGTSSCDICNGDGTVDHYWSDQGWVTFFEDCPER